MGYHIIITMSDTKSDESRNFLRAFGGELILTPGTEGMKGSIKKAEELQAKHGYFMPKQFDNMANPEVHARTTGAEIVEQMKDGVDAFISGIGTGGTITGAGKVLKENFPKVELYAVEPVDSAILSGGNPGPHKIQGIGAGFIPKVLDTAIYDDVIQISNDEAFATARGGAEKGGGLGGGSSRGAIAAAKQAAEKSGKGNTVQAMLPESAT